MATSSAENPKWKDFENYVAELYKEFGSQEVCTDINIEGNQIDVFANVPSFDGTYAKTIVSCKFYDSKVGVGAVREWYTVFRSLFDIGKADVGVVVSAKGFTQDGQALARKLGVKLVTIENLRWASADFRPYLKALTDKFSAEPVFTRNAYVPMRIRYDGTKTVVPVHEAIGEFLKSDTPGKLFLLLGDCGAGKTTVCKFLFKDFVAQFLKNGIGRVPIFINLRDYPEHLNLQSLITHVLVNEYRSRCSGFVALERLLREGRIVIFLDAFDEMASRSDYKTTLRNFHAIKSLLVGEAKVILTCRTHFFKDKEELDAAYAGTELYRLSMKNNYKIAYLQGFAPEEIKMYVKAVCPDNWERYYKLIQETYNLKAIAERPLLLDMITEVFPELVKQKRDITSATLYQLYTRFWLKRDDWRTSLTSEEREHFTIAFAEAIYREKKETFSWGEVEQAISAHWPNCTRRNLDYYKSDIRTCSFIRRRPDTEDYEFIHESLVEFFVSSYLHRAILDENPEAFMLRNHTPEVLAFLSHLPHTERVIKTVVGWFNHINNIHLFVNCFRLLTEWLPQFQGYTFQHISLEGIDVKNNFCDNIFENAHLRNVTMSNNEILKCDFRKVHFDRCNLSDTNLKQVIFNQCIFRDSVLNVCDTKDVQFLEGTVANCDISGAQLRGTIFKGTRIGENIWSFESLDGLTFRDVRFEDKGRSIEKVLCDSRRQWKKAPIFRDVTGLGVVSLKLLKQFGANLNL